MARACCEGAGGVGAGVVDGGGEGGGDGVAPVVAEVAADDVDAEGKGEAGVGKPGFAEVEDFGEAGGGVGELAFVDDDGGVGAAVASRASKAWSKGTWTGWKSGRYMRARLKAVVWGPGTATAAAGQIRRAIGCGSDDDGAVVFAHG